MNSSKSVKTLTVVTAVNLNTRYLECVPAYIDFWLEFSNSRDLRISPRVVLVANLIPESLEKYERFISLVPPCDLNSAFVAQNIRTLVAGEFQTDYVMTSDVDMLPLNLKVTSRALQTIEEEDFAFCVVRDVLEPGQYAICYGLASPSSWRKIMSTKEKLDPIVELNNVARDFEIDMHYDGEHGGGGWFIDQEYLYRKVMSRDELTLIKLSDDETGHRRLDRAHHPKLLTWMLLPLVAFGYFSDYHIHLPYLRSQNLVNALRYAVCVGRKFPWSN